jgi:hypothetical protein
MAAWATVTQVSEWLGTPVDQRMTDATAAADVWAQRVAPWWKSATTVPTDVSHAVVLYAALLYRERTSPQGYATYTEMGAGELEGSAAMTNIYRLLGTRKPVAR